MTKMMLGELTTFEHMGRQITMFLPKAYHLFPERNFPAVFLQDGDFLFKESIADIERDVEEGITEPVIFIGIDSQLRNNEYTPWEMPALFKDWSFGGKGDDYLNYVYQDLVPYIKSLFRISNEPKKLALGGVSLGGLISLYAMYKNEDVFNNFILISASVWFKDFIHYMENTRLDREYCVYMYVGEQEGILKTNAQKDMVPNSKRAYDIIKGKIDGADQRVKFETDPLGTHHDTFFLQYFPNSIRYLFPAK
ncbi:alpha/beta hydrolase-fold protein [Paenibacillus sp. FSL E2-0201]|uniref:alpha/beta hydrolase n=1 Tax=Paenibacillus sp. FSL E2-0201 TaxID=2954726 RepID=UPI0030DCEC03